MLRLLGGWAVDDDIAEFRPAVQSDPESHIGKSAAPVDVHFRMDFGFEIAVAVKKGHKRFLRFLEIHGRIRFLGGIIRHLQQPRVRKLFGAGKLIQAEVHGGLQNEQDSDAIPFGMEVELTMVPFTTDDEGNEIVTFAFQPV